MYNIAIIVSLYNTESENGDSQNQITRETPTSNIYIHVALYSTVYGASTSAGTVPYSKTMTIETPTGKIYIHLVCADHYF